MAKKQVELPGMERKTIIEMDDLAESYEAVRDARMKLTEKEKDAKEALLRGMKRNKLKVYKDTSASPPILVTVEEGEENVKVKRVAEDEKKSKGKGGKKPKRARREETDEEAAAKLAG